MVSTEGELLWELDPVVDGGFTFPRFSPDGARLYFIGHLEDGAQGVWSVRASDGGGMRQIVRSDDPSLWIGFGIRVGRSYLYLGVGEYQSDIWVMDLTW